MHAASKRLARFAIDHVDLQLAAHARPRGRHAQADPRRGQNDKERSAGSQDVQFHVLVRHVQT
jgi:hypothetical protein